jgi:hypothetical protein
MNLVLRSVLPVLMSSTAFGASIFFSTDGTATPGYTPGLFWTASFTLSGPSSVSVEMQFTSSTTGTVTSIVAPLSATLSDVTFALRSDAAGMAGVVIDLFTFHSVTGTPQLLSAPSMNHGQLTAGTLYWLEAVAPVPSIQNQSVNWYDALPSVNGNVEVENPVPAVLTNQSMAAFAVNGIVPEPATLFATGLALVLLSVLYRRGITRSQRRRGTLPKSP